MHRAVWLCAWDVNDMSENIWLSCSLREASSSDLLLIMEFRSVILHQFRRSVEGAEQPPSPSSTACKQSEPSSRWHCRAQSQRCSNLQSSAWRCTPTSPWAVVVFFSAGFLGCWTPCHLSGQAIPISHHSSGFTAPYCASSQVCLGFLPPEGHSYISKILSL